MKKSPVEETEKTERIEEMENSCGICDNAVPEGIMRRLFKATRTALFIRGTLFIVFGILLLFQEQRAIPITVMILGIYIIVEGIAMLLKLMRLPGNMQLLFLFNGLLLLLLGVCAVVFPWMMGEYAVIFFGAWQLISGIQFFLLMKTPGHRVRVFVSGLFSIIAGLFFIFMPLLGLLALTWVFSLLFIATGMMMYSSAITMQQYFE